MTQVPTILVVDDDKDFREILVTKLTASGFRVETAINGEEGIMKAQAVQPDLMLLDMKMPGLSGADVLNKLKEHPMTKNLKVLFITAFGDPRFNFGHVDSRIAQEVGAVGYLKKTDNLDILLEQIRGYLAS